MRTCCECRDAKASNGVGIIQISGDILRESFEAFSDSQSRREPMPVWEGVQVIELIECSTAALHALSKEATCRQLICRLGLVATCVQLLPIDHENTLRSALGVLNEVGVDADGLALIEQSQPLPVLLDLLRTDSNTISACTPLLCTYSFV